MREPLYSRVLKNGYETEKVPLTRLPPDMLAWIVNGPTIGDQAGIDIDRIIAAKLLQEMS